MDKIYQKDLQGLSNIYKTTPDILKTSGTPVPAPEPLPEPRPTIDGHEYVDLGLPSGKLWAAMNVGATNDMDLGTEHTWDPSFVNTEMGGRWYMPTYLEWYELFDNTTIEFYESDGQCAAKLTGANGKFILIPAVESLHFILDAFCYYWNSSYSGAESYILFKNKQLFQTGDEDGNASSLLPSRAIIDPNLES